MNELWTTLFAGGASGLIGTGISGIVTWLNRREERKVQKMKFSHELELRKLDQEIIRTEARNALEMARVSAKARADIADSDLVKASYAEAATRISEPEDHGWIVAVDVIRGLLRPALTVFLLSVSVIMWAVVWDKQVSEATREDLAGFLLHALAYCTVTSILWWFGSRHIDKAMDQKPVRRKPENPLNKLKL